VSATVIRPVEVFIATPDGTADGIPNNVYVIGNVPADVTWNVPPVPVTTYVKLSLFIKGATGVGCTYNVKLCESLNNEFAAVIVKEYVFAVRPEGIVIIPVDGSIVTPAGSVPSNE
jgi:hypothetical protein